MGIFVVRGAKSYVMLVLFSHKSSEEVSSFGDQPQGPEHDLIS
jgi:hypothetical protein